MRCFKTIAKQLLSGSWAFLILLCGIQCQVEEKPISQKIIPSTIAPLAIDSSAIQYLLFCEEGVLEIWTNDPPRPFKQLETIALAQQIHFPIGKYPLKKLGNSVGLEYPNAFYQEKLGNKTLEQRLLWEEWATAHPPLGQWLAKSKQPLVLVLPNDPREGGQWKGCFACPHWMAELYSSLEVEMTKFQ